MTRPNSTPIPHNVELANVWLREIARRLGVNRHLAWSILSAVLRTLRDRLSPEQNAHLGNQLPLIIRGALYEQWRPGRKAKKVHNDVEFLNAVADKLPPKSHVPVVDAVKAVFAILRKHPTGAIHKILRTLPPKIRGLGTAEEPELQDSLFAWE